MFNDKKFIKKMFFSVIYKNLNWEILTKNLVTFKKWEGVKDEKFQHYGDSLKNLIFIKGLQKANKLGGGRGEPKKGGLDNLLI